jgi:hypothetical protein
VGAVKILVIVAFAVPVAVIMGGAFILVGGGDEIEGAGGGGLPADLTTADPGDVAVVVARKSALVIVKEIAEKITPEMGDALERVVKAGKRRGEDYRAWRDFLEPLRTRYGVTSLYAMVRIDRETAGVVVEVGEGSEKADRWLAPYEMERAMRRAFAGRAAVRRGEPWFDPRIRGGAPHVRAVAPVLDSAGEVVAIVGVDVEVGDQRVAR